METQTTTKQLDITEQQWIQALEDAMNTPESPVEGLFTTKELQKVWGLSGEKTRKAIRGLLLTSKIQRGTKYMENIAGNMQPTLSFRLTKDNNS